MAQALQTQLELVRLDRLGVQMVERQGRHRLQGLDGDVAANLLDHRQIEQLAQEQALVMLQIWNDDLEQIVGPARHDVARDDLRHGQNARLEGMHALVGVAIDLDPHEYRETKTDAVAPKHCAISLDVALALQALDPAQARGGRQADLFGQVDIAEPAIGLQSRDDTAINRV